MGEPALTWWPEELQAFQLPEELTVSEWADRDRVLPPETSASPGPWSTDVTPYLRELMDCFGDVDLEQVTFCKPTQVGGTEAAVNVLGYVVDQDPSPALVVLPDDPTAQKWCVTRWQSTVKASPALARHVRQDVEALKVKETLFDRCMTFFASANSPAALASQPIRVLILDEVDKFRAQAGREANPIKLSRERTKTFWNRKVYVLSTPTTEEGYVWTEFQKGSQEYCWLPCPHCGVYHVLDFKNVKWPEDERDPERILEGRLAAYFCPSCGEEIQDHEKPAMLKRYRWVSRKYETIDPATGEVRGERPRPLRHRSFWLNSLYSPWVTWSEMAAEFLRSHGSPQDLQNFVNSWQALPWRDRVESPQADLILNLRCELAPCEAPAEAVAIVAGIDMQRDHFWFSVWAFSEWLSSWLLDYGKLQTWDEVENLVHGATYTRPGLPDLGIWRAGLDTGGTKEQEEGWSRTEEAYAWLRAKGGGTAFGVKGYAAQNGHGVQERVRETTAGAKGWEDLPLFLVNRENMTTLFFERLLHGHEMANPQPVRLHKETGLDFARHVLAVERRRDTRRGGRFRWEKLQARRRDILDTCLYAHATVEAGWRGGLARALAIERTRPAVVPVIPAAVRNHPMNLPRFRPW